MHVHASLGHSLQIGLMFSFLANLKYFIPHKNFLKVHTTVFHELPQLGFVFINAIKDSAEYLATLSTAMIMHIIFAFIYLLYNFPIKLITF